MNDNELFNLCKAVYEATEFDSDDLQHFLGGEIHYKRLFESDMHHLNTTKDTYAPLYTSDYLLSKIPPSLYEGDNWISLDNSLDEDLWAARYDDGMELDGDERLFKISGGGDTPLNALLELTLELHKNNLLELQK